MFYRINHSCDPKVIGNVNSQAEHALFDVDSKDPNLSRNIFLKKIVNVESVITISAFAGVRQLQTGRVETVGEEHQQWRKVLYFMESVYPASLYEYANKNDHSIINFSYSTMRSATNAANY